MCCIWELVAFVMSVALYISHKYRTAEAKAVLGILPSCADAVGVTVCISSLCTKNKAVVSALQLCAKHALAAHANTACCA
jgi:hypothetical protein